MIQDTSIFLWTNLWSLRLHSPHHLENTNISKYLLDLHKHVAYLQELMTGILIGFNFKIAYLDDIIIFSRTPEEHLGHFKQDFQKIKKCTPIMKLSRCNFFTKEIQYLGYILSTKGIRPLPSKTHAINKMHPLKHLNKYAHFSDSSDIIGNLSGIPPRWPSHWHS